MRPRTAFTLIELLVASVLAAVLMVGVLAVLGSIGRDRRRVDADAAVPRHDALLDLVRWDVANADTMAPLPGGRGGVVLVGHGGLDPATAAPTGRLTRVTYRVVFPNRDGNARTGADRPSRGGVLVRGQEYLDAAADPNRAGRWTEVVATGATAVALAPASPDAEAVPAAPGGTRDGPAVRIPSRVRLRVEFVTDALDQEWRTR